MLHSDAGPVAAFDVAVAEGDVAVVAVVAQQVFADVVEAGVVVAAGVADVQEGGSC
jgi:hypothetical protein